MDEGLEADIDVDITVIKDLNDVVMYGLYDIRFGLNRIKFSALKNDTSFRQTENSPNPAIKNLWEHEKPGASTRLDLKKKTLSRGKMMKENKDMESKLKKQGSQELAKDQVKKLAETDQAKKPTEKDVVKKPTDLEQAKNLIDEVLVQNTGMNAFTFSAETNDDKVDQTEGSANPTIKTLKEHEKPGTSSCLDLKKKTLSPGKMMKEKKDMESKLKKQGSNDLAKDKSKKLTETDQAKKPTVLVFQVKKSTDLDQAKTLIDEVLVQNTGMNAFKFSAETEDEKVDQTDGSANPVIKTLKVTETTYPVYIKKNNLSPGKLMKEKENKESKLKKQECYDLAKDLVAKELAEKELAAKELAAKDLAAKELAKKNSKPITIELKRTPKRYMIVLGNVSPGARKVELLNILKKVVPECVKAREDKKHKPDKMTVQVPFTETYFNIQPDDTNSDENETEERPTVIEVKKFSCCKQCSTEEKKVMTKYMCLDCREPLCLFPCFQYYHEDNGKACKGFSPPMDSTPSETEIPDDLPNDIESPSSNSDEIIEPAMPSASASIDPITEQSTPNIKLNESDTAPKDKNGNNKKMNESNSRMIEGPNKHWCAYCKGTTPSPTNVRRMTKFHCGGCSTSLCNLPCFKLYHEERDLTCHLLNSDSDEINNSDIDNEKMKDLELAKLKARNKMIFYKLVSQKNEILKQEKELKKKVKKIKAAEKKKREKMKRKWKEKEQKLKAKNKRLKEELRASRDKVAQKNVTIKTLRKKIAVKMSLLAIMTKRLEKAKSNKHLPRLIKEGVEEFLKSKNLTPAQIKCLLNNKRRARVTKDDILNSLYLRSISSRAYEYLRKNGILYLPSRQTIEKWLNGMMTCKNGFNDDAITVQRKKLEASDNPLYKYTQLTFDEVHIKQSIELNRKDQEVIGPHSKLQTVMIRGLACD